MTLIDVVRLVEYINWFIDDPEHNRSHGGVGLSRAIWIVRNVLNDGIYADHAKLVEVRLRVLEPIT